MALDPITEGLSLAGRIVDRIWPNKTEENLAQIELARTQIAGAIQERLANIQIEVERAKSSSVFVAGARPAITWVCAAALAYQFLMRPILPWLTMAVGHPLPEMPSLDENLWELTATTIGMAGWRSFDKRNGKA